MHLGNPSIRPHKKSICLRQKILRMLLQQCPYTSPAQNDTLRVCDNARTEGLWQCANRRFVTTSQREVCHPEPRSTWGERHTRNTKDLFHEVEISVATEGIPMRSQKRKWFRLWRKDFPTGKNIFFAYRRIRKSHSGSLRRYRSSVSSRLAAAPLPETSLRSRWHSICYF